MVSYCCDTLEGKHIPHGKHENTALRSIRCFLKRDDICHLTNYTRWLQADIELAYVSYEEFLDVSDALYRKVRANDLKKSYIVSSIGSEVFNKNGSMLQSNKLTIVARSSYRC